MIHKIIDNAIALCMEGKIPYQKIFVLNKSILQLNYIESNIITKVLGETLSWLEADPQVDEQIINSFFDVIFVLLRTSSQAHHHIMNNFPTLLAIHTSKSSNRFSVGHNRNDLHAALLNYLYIESNKNTAGNKQLNQYLKFLITYYISKNQNIEDEDLFWFLIGRNMSTYEINNNAPIFNPIDLGQTNLLEDLSELHHVLYRILHSQPEETSPHTVAKILFSFSGLVINNFGFQYMMDILTSWYDMEENVNFRYGFHLTYVSLISNHQNPEMTLNFSSHIIYKETDADLLIKVLFDLYDISVGWNLIYPFVILPLIHNNDITQESFKKKISQIYNIYLEDLMKSNSGKLLSRTEDLFLIFWSISNKRQKRHLLIPLKKWIDDFAERTNTIKGTFVKSLILRTTEPEWINALNKLYTSLGKMTVQILDDQDFYTNSLLKIYDNQHTTNLAVASSTLPSIIRNDYCMACKVKIGSKKSHFCDVCKFSFCNQCFVAGEVFEDEHYCLGSALSSVKHKFKTLQT